MLSADGRGLLTSRGPAAIHPMKTCPPPERVCPRFPGEGRVWGIAVDGGGGHGRRHLFRSVQCLLDVLNDIFHVLDTHRQANQVGSHSGFAQLIVRELAVRMAGRMQHAGARVRHVSDDGHHLQAVHEADGIFFRAFQAEGDDAARAVRQVFLSQLVVFVALQSAVVHPSHPFVLFQKLGHGLCVLAVALHAQVQRFQAQIEQEAVERAGDGAQVAHQLCRGFGDVSHLAESLGIGQSMVAFVRLAQARELVGMGHPVEVAAVHDGAAHRRGMSVHVFRGGMYHNVGPPLEGAAVDGGGEGVVHDEGHAVAVRHGGEALNVEHVPAGVRDGFAEEALRVRTEGGLDAFVVPIRVYEGAFDAQLLHRHAEEVERAAINGVRGHEMVARLADVEHGIEVGSLARRGQHGAHTAFQLGDFAGHGVVRGVLQAGIEIARVFQVEEPGHLVAVVVFECCALVDGEHARLTVLRSPSRLYADGFLSQFLFHFSLFFFSCLRICVVYFPFPFVCVWGFLIFMGAGFFSIRESCCHTGTG